jgi:hypothetical protein
MLTGSDDMGSVHLTDGSTAQWISTVVTVVALAHAGIVLVMAIGQVCKVNKRGIFTISVFIMYIVMAGIPPVLEADRMAVAACGYLDYSMPTISSWTACSVITPRAAIRDNGSLAEFFLDCASGNFSHTPYLHDFAAFDDHTIVNSTAVDGTPMVSMSGGTVDVIALDRQRRLYAFTMGNVRYATSCNARLLGQYEQATWGHHLFTDTNLFIREDGAQLPVNIVQRHGNKKYALALIIVPQSRFGDPYLNDGTLIPRTTCSINWTAVRELFHHGGGWLNVTNDSNGAHCNILPACCRDRSYSGRVSECKNMYTWIPNLNATILSKKGGSNVSNITDMSTDKGGSMDLDACAKPSGNGGSNYSCSNCTTYAPYCFVDLSDDPFGNRVEKIRLTCNITVLLDGDNNSCREVVSTITDTDRTGYRHRPDRAHGTCLATFPKVANTTSWCSPDRKNSHQDTWRQMIHCMVSAKLIPGPVLRTGEEIARDSRRLAAASAGAADTISSVRTTPNGGGACSPINMMTSAVVGEPVSHAAVKTATKQTYLGHNEDMLLKLQRTDTVLAGDNTQKEDRLRRNNEQMDSNTTTMLLVKQNLWLRLQQQLLLGQQPKSCPDSVQPDLVRATFEAATRAELQPNTYHDQGSQWIESRRAAASNADPPGDVDHPWHSCSCEEHSWHCDTKGMPLFFVCNLLVYADTPLTGQQWEQQRIIVITILVQDQVQCAKSTTAFCCKPKRGSWYG